MPPIDTTPDTSPDGDSVGFKLTNYVPSSNFPLFEYRSEKTNLTVYIAEVEGPIVGGYFCLATEAVDDDGLPHTLEHLIFMGSEDYPYKGVLDLLANRCLASGTNAWTDVDHTCYTMETAGSDGFLTLMPIFLDHILYPLLTDSAFITEVHHVTADGNDAGVVYCEMQGRENTANSKLYYNLKKAMYHGVGYSCDTGGVMKNLRESTTNEKVKQYHRKFYRPENLKIIITGKVNHRDVFRALEPFELKILSKGERGSSQRPWQTPVPPLTESKDLRIEYPTDEENNGLFTMAWRGPSSVTEQYKMQACTVLLKYLTEHPTYTLPKEFIEIDDPYASHVTYNIMENSVSCLSISFRGIPLAKIDQVKPKLQEILRTIVEKEDINMTRMNSVISRTKLQFNSSLENSPHESLSYLLILHILYGNTKEDLQERLNAVQNLDKLSAEPAEFWLNFIKEYLVDSKYVALQGIPSKNEYVRMTEEETQRIEKQRQVLGEAGLLEQGLKLQQAITNNSTEPPVEEITRINIKDLSSINFHQINRFSSNDDPKGLGLENAGVFTFFDDIKSEFVYLYAMINTWQLSMNERTYLPLMLKTLFESPIMRDGQLVPYEVVVEELNATTVKYGADTGLHFSDSCLFSSGIFSHVIMLKLQADIARFPRAAKLLEEIITQVVFTAERLKIVATKMLNNISDSKRSPSLVASHALNYIFFLDKCNVLTNTIFRQQNFLTGIVEQLSSANGKEVEGFCNDLWKKMTVAKHINLHVAGNADKINGSLFKDYIHPCVQPLRVLPRRPDYMCWRPHDESERPPLIPKHGSIIGMACLESSYMFAATHSVLGWKHNDILAVRLFCQYLVQAEGLMWKQIRGKGYAYGYHLYLNPSLGMLYLVFQKATNLFGAYTEARNIIQDLLDNRNWDQNLLESAKSSLIFELVQKQKTISDTVALSVRSYFDFIDFNYHREVLNTINSITTDTLDFMGQKYIAPLINKYDVKTAIVCPPNKIAQLQEDFRSVDLDFDIYPSVDESFIKLYQEDRKDQFM